MKWKNLLVGFDPNYTSPEQKIAIGQREMGKGIGVFFLCAGLGLLIFGILSGGALILHQSSHTFESGAKFLQVSKEAKSVILTQGNYTCTGTYESCKELFSPNRSPKLVG